MERRERLNTRKGGLLLVCRLPLYFLERLLGGRNQMRRENVRGLGGDLDEECILFLSYLPGLMRSNSTKITCSVPASASSCLDARFLTFCWSSDGLTLY